MNIIEEIPKGQKNAVTGDDLCRKFDISKRTLRNMINAAQDKGIVILNLQDGRGYFRPSEDEAHLVERYAKQERHRALSSLVKIKACRNWNPNQLELANDT